MTSPSPTHFSPVETVYIVEPKDHGWIIERLMRDIGAQLNLRGVETHIGPQSDYGGQDVVFNSRYLTPLADKRARVNSLFITHIDDQVKELEFRSRNGLFNSLVCLSAQDADFIAGLVGTRSAIAGIDLPARELTVRPIRIAMFSAHYKDGRKNEQWIIDYFEVKDRAYRDNFVICLMGWGWEQIGGQLGELEMNYEIYRYSRFMEGEYAMYKEVLSSMDCLIYLGFDGGAMCVYDALAAGVDVIATDISYHRGLGETVALVASKEMFFEEIEQLHRRNVSRKVALAGRSIETYTTRLLEHWNRVANGGDLPVPNPKQAVVEVETVKLFRSHYKPMGLSRVRSFAIRSLQRLLGL